MSDFEKSLKNILKDKTVFILGAGASQPYGLPLGSDLKKQSMVSGSGLPHLLVNVFGYDSSLIDQFKKTLNYSVYPTIDIFLENKPRFRGIGSACIAHTIMSRENERKLFPQKNWYGSIFDAFELGTNSINLENLTVLTFNYDRSFEHFFNDNINYNCRQDLEEIAVKELKKVNIIHLHGAIGEYPKVPYGTNPSNIDIWIKASENIKIVSDKIEDSLPFIKARKEILDAKNVVFLGFGYDIQTLQKILKEINFGDKNMIGSAMNVEDEDRVEINNIFENKIILGQKHHDCDAFLRNKKITKQ